MDAFIESFRQNLLVGDRWIQLLKGLGVTMNITIWAMIIGTIVGTVLALMKISKLTVLRGIASVYIDIVRGIPLVTQLLIMYFVVFASAGVSRNLVAIITFGLNSGGYVAEIIRSGIVGVDKGQLEAGRSLGLTHAQAMTHIVMPQAIKNFLPTYASEFIVLIKETAVVGYIAIEDLTKIADIIRSRTFDAFFPLITAALMYLIITTILSKLFGYLERRMRASDNR